MDHAVLDKRIHLGAGAQVGRGDGDQVSYVPAGGQSGLTVIGKNTRIPAHTRIGPDCSIAADLSEDAFEKDWVASGTGIEALGE